MLSSRDLGRDTFDVPECRTPAIRSRLARYPLALELVQLRNRVASPPAQPGIEGSHRINGWTNQLFLPLQVLGREVGTRGFASRTLKDAEAATGSATRRDLPNSIARLPCTRPHHRSILAVAIFPGDRTISRRGRARSYLPEAFMPPQPR